MDFDPNATMFIKMSQLVDFFKVLREPMGFGFNFFISDRELWDKIRTCAPRYWRPDCSTQSDTPWWLWVAQGVSKSGLISAA